MSYFEQKPVDKQRGVLKMHSELAFYNKNSFKQQEKQAQTGYQLQRLLIPSLQEFNEDFLCYVCKQIVKEPLECPRCQILFCRECSTVKRGEEMAICLSCERESCPVEEIKLNKLNKILTRIYERFQLSCQICSEPYTIEELHQHESEC